MTTYNPRMDAAPVAISGSVGSTVSLYDLLVKAYGENISQIQSVFVNVQSEYGIYWNGAATGPTTLVTDASNNQIGSGGENILAPDFKNVQIKIGDNINNIVNVTVPESSGNGPFVGHTLSVSVLPSQLDEHVPADHVPTAADIVASAKMFATAESGVFNSNDCHGIATAIAASAGATLDPNTGNTLDIAANPNEQSGFWRIAATGAAVAANWETQVQAGDIVRFEHEDNGVLNQHTVTVVSGLNAAGQIEVVDNWNSVISDHWIDFNKATDVLPGTVTIFRLTTDGLYLTDQSKETTNDNILGTTFNDLIKAGSGNDTLTGGAGNDTLDGGAGDNTAVFSGKESDYKITVAGGTATIADLRAGSPDGTDTITNIEHVKFSDVTVNYSDLKPTPVAPPPVAGSVTIDNVSMAEGNNGTVLETFTVTRIGGNAAFDVNFATADGTATAADKDYNAQSGTLHFAQGVVSQTISVVVHGDTKVEGNETYDVDLSGATNGATISHAEGVGTIVNDDTAAATVTSHVVNDFNGDGISDVLLGNNNGTLALWELNGNQITSNTTVGSVASGWHVEGTADFNGDGTADILLHSDNGSVALWQMNGDHIVSNNTFGTIGTDFHVAGVGDFSGDGKSDILWQNSQGQVVMWEMNGDHIASNTTVGTMGTDFKVAGVGDFNGDGKSDILWENSKGQVVMWEMNGDKIASNTTVGNVSPDWHVAGTGDFNGDGKTDILWQNSKGQIAEWQMNGDHVASNTTVGSASGMTVIGTGDYNHDGKADVLLQDTSGHVTEWQMNGDHITATQSVGSHSTDWHMV
jgi:hypothetical protein